MKFNKWTLGLAAVGAVSMASAVRADEAKLSQVQTALSNTTISGYVDVGVQYNTGSQAPRTINQYDAQVNQYEAPVDKRDQFALNNVTISLDKPLDDSPWAAGYHIDLNAGTDSINGFNTHFGYANATIGTPVIRQAYIALRTPVGNGIDWKLGVQDGITGYEGNTAYSNPNYSRSFGYAINPASYTGLLGTYKICDMVSVTAGIVNRGVAQGYGQSNHSLNSLDYVGSVSLTAPDSWGFLKGSALNLQTVQGFDNAAVDNYSINGTLSTPIAGLKVGFAVDILQSLVYSADGNIYGLYASYQATDKLSFAVRGEYLTGDLDVGSIAALNGGNGYNYTNDGFMNGEEVTATVAYNLWANVVTRAEIRWDHVEHGTTFYTSDENSASNQFVLALNVVYKF